MVAGGVSGPMMRGRPIVIVLPAGSAARLIAPAAALASSPTASATSAGESSPPSMAAARALAPRASTPMPITHSALSLGSAMTTKPATASGPRWGAGSGTSSTPTMSSSVSRTSGSSSRQNAN